MFLGHFALAMAAKKIAPKASLGTLVLSAQFADCLWPVLLRLGLEQARIVPGMTRVIPLDFISYPISHSLLLQLVWGFLLGRAYFLWRRDPHTALVVAHAKDSGRADFSAPVMATANRAGGGGQQGC